MQAQELKISIPKSWGLGSPQSNQAFTKKAQSLVKNLEKVQAKGGDFSLYIHAMSKYVKSYKKSCTRTSYKEAAETLPRDCVLIFLKNCSNELGISEKTVSDLWHNTQA